MVEDREVGRPLKFESNEELEKKIEEYFLMCKEEKRPLTVSGLALALDTTRDVLLDYQNEKMNNLKEDDKDYERKKKLFQELSNTIKRAKQTIENYAEEYLFTGKNVAGAIFNLMNNWKWKNRNDNTSDDKPLEPNVNVVALSGAELDEYLKKLTRKE